MTALFLGVMVEVKERRGSTLKRILKLLAATAPMVVLMATTVSPAFASNAWWANTSGAPGQECKGKDNTAVKNDQNWGWHEGEK